MMSITSKRIAIESFLNDTKLESKYNYIQLLNDSQLGEKALDIYDFYGLK